MISYTLMALFCVVLAIIIGILLASIDKTKFKIKTKTVSPFDMERIRLIRIAVVIFFIFIMVISIAGIYFMKTKQFISYNAFMFDFNSSLERLQDNCDSMFITKKYNDDNLYVFTKVCNTQNYCKYEYIPIEKCLV